MSVTENKISKIFAVLVAITLFAIPFGRGVANSMTAITMLFGIWSALKQDFSVQLTKNQKFLLISLYLYFFIFAIGIFYSTDKKLALDSLKDKLYLVIIPPILLLHKKILQKYYKDYLKLFVVGNIFSGIILLIRAFIRSVRLENHHLIFQPQINPKESFLQSISNYGNHFFYGDFSRFYHPSYASVMVISAIAALLYLPQIKAENSYIKLFEKELVRVSAIIFLIIFTLLLSSKAGFFSLIAVLFIYFYKQDFCCKKIVVVTFAVATVSFVMLNPRFSIYYTYLKKDYKIDEHHVYTGTKRLFLWKAGVEIIKDNPWTGVGTGDIKAEIQKRLPEKVFSSYSNLHSEFIDTFARTGIIGFLIFLSLLYFMFKSAISDRNSIQFLVTFNLLINYIFLAMLLKSAATLFLSFVYLIIVFGHNQSTGQNSEQINYFDKKIG